jgi:hypothetical protein
MVSFESGMECKGNHTPSTTAALYDNQPNDDDDDYIFNLAADEPLVFHPAVAPS